MPVVSFIIIFEKFRRAFPIVYPRGSSLLAVSHVYNALNIIMSATQPLTGFYSVGIQMYNC